MPSHDITITSGGPPHASGVASATSRSRTRAFIEASVAAVFRQTEDAFGDDVALNVRRAAADDDVRPAQRRFRPFAAIDGFGTVPQFEAGLTRQRNGEVVHVDLEARAVQFVHGR